MTGLMPRRVTAVGFFGKRHPIETEDEVSAIFEYDSGAIGHFYAATGEFPGVNRLELAGARARIALAGPANRQGRIAGANAAGAEQRTPEERPAYRLWARLALIVALFFFYTRWLVKPEYFSPLDFVNLAFHEAGHIFLNFFGHFIMMAGGTIFQLLIPSICLVHLLRRGLSLGWQLCLFWIGENLLNISIYAGDAIKQTLPLCGGGVHDWTYLLTATGLIAHTTGVGKFIFAYGSAVIFCSLLLIGRDAVRREPIDLGAGREPGGQDPPII